MKRILLADPVETERHGCTSHPLGLLFIGETLLRHGFDVRPDAGMV